MTHAIISTAVSLLLFAMAVLPFVAVSSLARENWPMGLLWGLSCAGVGYFIRFVTEKKR